MKINPGSLNKRIKIYGFPDANVDVEDGGGGYEDRWDEVHGWEYICDAWASIRPAGERAQTLADQTAVIITHTVLIRYNPAVKVSHVINFDGRRLDIRTIRNFDEENQYLQLMCEEEA